MEFDQDRLALLLRGFEDGTWPAKDFTHAAHLAVGACYAMDFGDGLALLRERIPRYNVSQGGVNSDERGYHETLTCFWFYVVREFIALLPAGLSREETVERVIAAFGQRRDLTRDYYDFDVVKSLEARRTWVPPSGGISGIRHRLREQAQSTAPA